MASGKKFKTSMFGFNKKQVFEYLRVIDEKYSNSIECKEQEIESLKEIDALAEQVAQPVDNPVYVQSDEEVQAKKRELAVLTAEVSGLKKRVKDMLDTLDNGLEGLQIEE